MEENFVTDQETLSRIESERTSTINSLEEIISETEYVNLLKGKLMLVTKSEDPKQLLMTIKLEFDTEGTKQEAVETFSEYAGQSCGVIL